MINNKDKKRVQLEQQTIYLLTEIFQIYPQYTMSQHLCHILRKKNESEQSYYWTEEVFLKKVEDYYDELNDNLKSENE